MRLKAAWAAEVIESASSRITILKGGHILPLKIRNLLFSKQEMYRQREKKLKTYTEKSLQIASNIKHVSLKNRTDSEVLSF